MTWNEGFYGNLGDISDTSELGYAELAYEYQELAMEPSPKKSSFYSP